MQYYQLRNKVHEELHEWVISEKRTTYEEFLRKLSLIKKITVPKKLTDNMLKEYYKLQVNKEGKLEKIE